MLFATEAVDIHDQRAARKGEPIVTGEGVRRYGEQLYRPVGYLVQSYNDESSALKAAIPDAVEVKGADSDEHKERSLMGFSRGEIRVLITKPSIAGWG